jgi:formylglycine-generating enzyme required for sulfatase activity
MDNRVKLCILLLFCVPLAGAGGSLTGGPERRMVRIPSGCYVFGPPDGSIKELARRICLREYDIDRSEVAAEDYGACVAAKVCAPMRVSESAAQRAQQSGTFPAGGITWEQAQTYCRWVKKRLPTDVEWERTARGPQMYRYPWGNAPPSRRRTTVRDFKDVSLGLRRVCTKPAGNSPEGLCDMADNVAEYVDGWVYSGDKWQIRYDSPEENEVHFARMVKGGEINLSIPEAWWLTPVRAEKMESNYFGFRCARDVGHVPSMEKK